MKKKNEGVTMHGPVADSEYPPTLSLHGKHAKAFIKHKIGDKVKIKVHGKKVSHSQNMGGNHNVSFDLEKVELINE